MVTGLRTDPVYDGQVMMGNVVARGLPHPKSVRFGVWRSGLSFTRYTLGA